MLMTARQHFAPPFAGAHNSLQNSAAFLDNYSSPFDSAPTAFAQNDAFTFGDSFTFEAQQQNMAQQPSGHTQDFQMFGDASYGRMSQQGPQPPRKRFRSNDQQNQSPSTFPQHLPTPTHTPTQSATSLDPNFYTQARPTTSAMAAAMRMGSTDGQQLEVDVPGYAHSGRSVSSYGQDSPATPRTMADDDSTQNGEDVMHFFDDAYLQSDDEDYPSTIPKFERQMPDIYNEDISDFYGPTSFATNASAKYAPVNSSLLSPYRNTVSERLQAANEARSTSPMDATAQRRSPFRQNSPYHMPSHDFGQMHTAVGIRQQQKARADAYAYQQHRSRADNSEPATISPKDAVLDYHEEEQETPLFPQTSASEAAGGVATAYSMPQNFNFVAPVAPTGIPSSDMLYMPQQYRQSSNMSNIEEPRFPPHLVSMESSVSDVQDPMPNSQETLASPLHRPMDTSASGGTYACTFPACGQRFESAGKLQKHRRETHNRPSPVGVPMSRQESAMSPASDTSFADGTEEDDAVGSNMSSSALMARNAQSGPHRCNRTNPATGKPCNSVFSRPYDLTRHEDTIHNNVKKKVRCQLCKEDKSFSRSDALTRHMRVVHPEVDFPGKHRRRHVS